MSDEAVKIVERQLEELRLRFGRDPGPGDQVFFDAGAEALRLIEHEKTEEDLLTAMTTAGLNLELIYAILQTARFVTKENSHLLSEEDIAEWQAAIKEYRRLQRAGKFN